MITIFGKKIRLFRPRSIWLRKVVQMFFFAFIALIAVNHTLVEAGIGIPFLSTASLHALCHIEARRIQREKEAREETK